MLLGSILLIFVSLVEIDCTCNENEQVTCLLNDAIDLITTAIDENISCSEVNEFDYEKALDCDDLYRKGYNKNGVYKVCPINRLFWKNKCIDVYCDMITDGGGWTVIQRKQDYLSYGESFVQVWETYKKGFGNLEEDFWLGNDNIFALTNQKRYAARFDLVTNQSEKVYAQYDNFWIDGEANKYMLHISGYSGTAGNEMWMLNNKNFSTIDSDNDGSPFLECAESDKGGWWYDKCYTANLNGNFKRLVWRIWKNRESYLSAEIKIRPFIPQKFK